MAILGSTNERKRQLEDIAQNQFGYFTAKQAESIGYTKDRNSYHVKNKHWIKISTGLFRLPNFSDSMNADFTRWSLWSRNQSGQPQGVVSHESALAYHNLIDYDRNSIHMTVSGRFRKNNPREVIIHYGQLRLSSIEHDGSFLVTRPLKTLIDMQEELKSERQWENITSMAFEKGMITKDELSRLDVNSAGSIFRDGSDKNNNPSTTISKFNCTENDVMANKGPCRHDKISEGVWNMITSKTFVNRSHCNAGFTIVELLVVVTIIMILASLLSPLLKNSVAAARSVSCAHNQNQIFNGCMLYASDYHDWMPPTKIYSQHIYHINHYFEQPCDGFVSDTYALIGFRTHRGLYFCPNAPDPLDSPSWDGSAVGEYHYPNYMPTMRQRTDSNGGGWQYVDSSTLPVMYRRLNTIKKNSAIMGETNFSSFLSIGEPVNICRPLYDGKWTYSVSETPTSRYAIGWNHPQLSANYLFIDGHVRSLNYTGTRFFDAEGNWTLR